MRLDDLLEPASTTMRTRCPGPIPHRRSSMVHIAFGYRRLVRRVALISASPDQVHGGSPRAVGPGFNHNKDPLSRLLLLSLKLYGLWAYGYWRLVKCLCSSVVASSFVRAAIDPNVSLISRTYSSESSVWAAKIPAASCELDILVGYTARSHHLPHSIIVQTSYPGIDSVLGARG